MRSATPSLFEQVRSRSERVDPWRINGSPLTVLPCNQAADAPDGIDAHLAEVRTACGPLPLGGNVCPDACREPFTVLTHHYSVCGGVAPPEMVSARLAGCKLMEPTIDVPCACAAKEAGWMLSCYNEEDFAPV